MPEEVARQYRIIAAERHGRKLVVATADPLNVVALDDLRRATGLEVDFKIGPGWAIQEAIEKTYRRMVSTEGIDEALRQDLGLSRGDGARRCEELVDIQQLRTQAADPPVVKVVNYVLSRAAADGASDIHVEAYEDRTRVRYRIDGLLFDLLEVPALAAPGRGLAAQDHLAARHRGAPAPPGRQLRLQHQQPRDRLPRVDAARRSTARRSCCASSRRKRSSSTTRSRTSGFEPEQLELFMRGIQRPWGMVLLTGPDGQRQVHDAAHRASRRIKSPRKNIITVEDPVEYRQPGIQQVQVKTEIGFDFARALRVHPAAGPGHHHGRRDPRPGDGADRGASRADRPPRAVDAAHQRRGLDASRG